MTKVAIVYHSGYGHTAALAEAVAAGVKRAGGTPNLLRIENAAQDFGPFLDAVSASDAVIFGAPTYMGDVSVGLRAFFEASSKIWFTQGWKDKLAAGFTVGASFGGNKDHTLMSMIVLSMQHGMIWSGPGVPNAQINRNTDAGGAHPNRIGSALGVVTQADNAAPDVTPPAGDKEFGSLLGERIAKLAAKLKA
ncbi:MAG: NADPH-dependent FMN reductase [Rhizobiales bacterium PAR1]|nr:MAG: NADPH-dependent FMN reductase [Rhizobiales bacterium PAR1]